MHVTLRTVAASTLVLGALLSGCSGDDGKKSSTRSTESASETAGPNAAAVDALIQKGLDQLAAGNDAAARGSFTSALVLDPTNVLGHYNLGVISQQDGKSVAALESYAAALKTQPDYVPALFNQAILTEDTDLDQAINDYRNILTLEPTLAAAHMRLGFALVHQGLREEGEASLERGIELDPSMTEVEAPSYK